MTVHIGHLRLLRQTRASPVLVVLAILANGTAVVLGAVYLSTASPMLLVWIAGFFVLALTIELILNRVTGRSVLARTNGHSGPR